MGLLASCPGAGGLFLRQRFYPRLFAACGRKVIFGRHVVIKNPAAIRIGQGVVLSDRCVLDAGSRGRISLGEGVFIGVGSELRAHDGHVAVDDGANVGSFCVLTASHALRVGRHVLLAAFCRMGEEGSGDIDVGDGSWLGVRVKVGAGVRIGQDAIVGAHAMVADDLPARAIAVGSPAKVIRHRS